MFSLFVAYVGTNLLYQERIDEEIRRILLSNGDKVIEIYKAADSDELIPFMQAFSGTAATRIQVFNGDETPLLDETLEIGTDAIETVLAGGTVDNISGGEGHLPIVGVPFQTDGEDYALFLTVDPNEVEDEIMNSIHMMYVVILFFGSLLVIIAARYVVHPLIQLTEATRRMAHGHFDIELPVKRKDEIGTLSASFNQMAKELGKLDQMRQEFVANVSHEIQSPLTSISGFSKALKDKPMNEENRFRYLSVIEQESERLSRLGRNLLRLSHLQHDQLRLNRSIFRLDEQLRTVVIALEPQWSTKELNLDIRLVPISIHADEDQLKQVWTNLLNNSIKFTPEHGTILIEATTDADRITVSVTDSGIGIPKEERQDIFKPFHKVDRARGTAVKGNGLGLSIVKQIVDLHKGEIRVSEGEAGGAKFIVTLPQDLQN